jgi:hypothetical protein
LPFDAVKVKTELSGKDLSVIEAKKQAGADLGKGREPSGSIPVNEIAKGGTGPWNMLKAAIDNLFGGAGIDALFGAEGFFPDTQQNRQVLRVIKQVGKSALMNSSRGAIWEQERIDKLFPDPDRFFTNPRTEAKKFKTLRDTLVMEKEFNNKAIQAAVDPVEVSKLRQANIEIDRLLILIQPGNKGMTSPEDEALINKYLRK